MPSSWGSNSPRIFIQGTHRNWRKRLWLFSRSAYYPGFHVEEPKQSRKCFNQISRYLSRDANWIPHSAGNRGYYQNIFSSDGEALWTVLRRRTADYSASQENDHCTYNSNDR